MKQAIKNKCYLALDSTNTAEIVNTVFGWEKYKPKYAEAFVYFFRRFGVSARGHDSYKELSTYLLETNTEGCYLKVSFCSFGFMTFSLYCEDEGKFFEIHKEERRHIYEWEERMKKYFNDKGEECFNIVANVSGEECNSQYKKWVTRNEDKIKDLNNEEMGNLFFNESLEKYKNQSAEYKSIEATPTENTYPTPVTDLCNKVFKEALEELLTPTYIRDVYININGEYKGDTTNAVEYFTK